MPSAISPHHFAEEFNRPLNLDEKIEIFIDRVQGWQIDPARAMAGKAIPHRGFAQLLIVISIFEMIGKYRSGFLGEGKSAQYFKEGLRWIFPEISANDSAVLDLFYTSIRNGLYHLGITRPNVVFIDTIPGSFGFHEERQALAISPDRFVEDIDIRFQVYARELRDPVNKELRTAFEQRFNDDNMWKPNKKNAA
jgi:hypothetical protein